MGWFGKKKASDTIDFTKMSNATMPKINKEYKFEGDAVDLRQERPADTPGKGDSDNVINPFSKISQEHSLNHDTSSAKNGMLGFLDSPSNDPIISPQLKSNVVTQVSEISELKTNMRKISTQIQDHSNEVYKLMQRIELLEKKIERLEGK